MIGVDPDQKDGNTVETDITPVIHMSFQEKDKKQPQNENSSRKKTLGRTSLETVVIQGKKQIEQHDGKTEPEIGIQLPGQKIVTCHCFDCMKRIMPMDDHKTDAGNDRRDENSLETSADEFLVRGTVLPGIHQTHPRKKEEDIYADIAISAEEILDFKQARNIRKNGFPAMKGINKKSSKAKKRFAVPVYDVF